MRRIVWLLLVAYTAFAGPWWLAAALGVLYIVTYRGWEIILIAALVDAGYGVAYAAVPWFTVLSVLLLIITSWLRPFMRGSNEMV